MKKILLAGAMFSAMTAAPAYAAVPTATYNFDGSVAALCSISGAATTVSFGALTDSNGAYTGNATSKQATDDAAYCNQASTTATIRHTNMFTSNTATSGFTNVIPMSAALSTTESAALSDSTSATGTGTSTGATGTIGAFTGLKVTATLGSVGSNKLVAGTYSGTITVTLTPSS